jgi:hypothetical protein
MVAGWMLGVIKFPSGGGSGAHWQLNRAVQRLARVGGRKTDCAMVRPGQNTGRPEKIIPGGPIPGRGGLIAALSGPRGH